MRYFFLLSIFLLTLSCSAIQSNRSISTHLLTSTGSSRATAYHDSDKIVNTEKYLFVTYLENLDGEEIVVVKRFNKKQNIWDEKTKFKNIKDDHGGASLVLDKSGYLHIIYGSHNSPLSYRKANNFKSIISWTSPVYLTGNYTYPSLVVDNDNNLLLVARKDKRKDNWSLVLLKKCYDRDTWEPEKEILTSNYNNWLNKSFSSKDFSISNGYVRFGKYFSVSGSNNLHITFQYFEYVPKGVKTYQSNSKNSATYLVGHIFSNDGGVSWVGQDGTSKKTLNISEVKLIDGKYNPSNVESNFSSGQHYINNDIIYFLYSKHYREETKLYLATSEYPYNNWKKKEIISDYYYLRAPATITSSNGRLYFSANAIPRDIYDNRSNKYLPSYSKIVTGNIALDLSDDVLYYDYKHIDLPSWLPQMSKSGESVWSMFTQGPRNKKLTKVYLIKVSE